MENKVLPKIVEDVTKPKLRIDLERVKIDATVVTNSIKVVEDVTKPELRIDLERVEIDAAVDANPTKHSRVVSNRCRYCFKFCSTEEELIEHETKHTVNKELKCPECGVGFARRSYLVEHACIHNGKKPHQCYYCSKAFTLRCNLVRHVRIHTGEKPFVCSICKKSFILKKNMIEHRRTHTGEKPFKCLHCDFIFSRRSSLVRHSRIHTGEKIYQCHHCHKSFSWKYYLRRHMSMHLKRKSKTRRRTRKRVEVFVDEAQLDQNIKEIALKDHSYTVDEKICDPNVCNITTMDPIPSSVDETEIISMEEEVPEEEEDDKSGIEICDFKISQEIDISPVYQRQLTVELPKRTSNSYSRADQLQSEEYESDEIRFKMTKSEFENFCNKRLLVRLRRLDQQTPSPNVTNSI